MRSRTEMVTTQLEGSDFDDESDFEDSEEDWQPAKGEPKPKVKSPGRSKKTTPTGKNGAKKRGRKPARKTKQKQPSSDEAEPDESDDDFSEPEASPVKKPKQPPKKMRGGGGETKPHTSAVTPVALVKAEPTGSANSSSSSSKPQPLQRKVLTPLKSIPDKFGFLNLYIFKGDLKDGIAHNPQVCLWRRDGSSLLQKYLRDKTRVDSDAPQFTSSMVYSCWEDKRADEYIEVKVRCIDQSKQIRVELTNVEELEAQSQNEYDSYVAQHGVPQTRSNSDAPDDGSYQHKEESDEDDEEEEDDVDNELAEPEQSEEETFEEE